MLYKGISVALLTSLVIISLILPLLAKINIIKKFVLGLSSEEYLGLVYLVLLIIILSWNSARGIWRKYKNNYSNLKYPPFVYLDYIVITIIFSLLFLLDFKIDFLLKLPLDLLKFLGSCLRIGIVWFFISYYLPEKKNKKQVLFGDILSRTDEPIYFEEQDLLGRAKFIEGLSQQIETSKFTGSFVFGLYGNWGEGKTSIINLLVKKFQRNNKFLVINFVPWHFKDSNAILRAFYKQVEVMFSKDYILPDLSGDTSLNSRTLST